MGENSSSGSNGRVTMATLSKDIQAFKTEMSGQIRSLETNLAAIVTRLVREQLATFKIELDDKLQTLENALENNSIRDTAEVQGVTSNDGRALNIVIRQLPEAHVISSFNISTSLKSS